MSHTGNKFLIIFTDDYSRYSALYALSKKSSAVDALRKYIDEHVVTLGTRLKALQADGGGEFLGSFADLCKINGTQIRLSAPDTQNCPSGSYASNLDTLDSHSATAAS